MWRRGSVVASWLLDLTAISLLDEPTLDSFSGRVSDSGEGRWTIVAAIESTTPAPVLSAALYQRFSSQGEDDLPERFCPPCVFSSAGTSRKSPDISISSDAG